MVDLGAPVLQLASACGSAGIRAPFAELRVTQTGSHRSGGPTVSSSHKERSKHEKICSEQADSRCCTISVPHFPSREAWVRKCVRPVQRRSGMPLSRGVGDDSASCSDVADRNAVYRFRLDRCRGWYASQVGRARLTRAHGSERRRRHSTNDAARRHARGGGKGKGG